MNRDLYFYVLNIIADLRTLLAYSSTCKLIRKFYTDNKNIILNSLTKTGIITQYPGYPMIVSYIDYECHNLYHGFYVHFMDKAAVYSGMKPNITPQELLLYNCASYIYKSYKIKYMSHIEDGKVYLADINKEDYRKYDCIAEFGMYKEGEVDDVCFEYYSSDLYPSIIRRTIKGQTTEVIDFRRSDKPVLTYIPCYRI